VHEVVPPQVQDPALAQAAGVPAAVRKRLIGPTHCSCTKTRKVPSCPSSLLLQ